MDMEDNIKSWVGIIWYEQCCCGAATQIEESQNPPLSISDRSDIRNRAYATLITGLWRMLSKTVEMLSICCSRGKLIRLGSAIIGSLKINSNLFMTQAIAAVIVHVEHYIVKQ